MSSKAVMMGAIVFFALFIGLGFLLAGTEPVPPPDMQSDAPPEFVQEVTLAEGEVEAPTRKYIARETVEGLYYGISYEYAEETFGFPSDEDDSEYDPGVDGYTSPFVIHWHVWKNEDGTKARLGFINNKMDRKQFIEADGTDALPESPHVDVDNYGRYLGIGE